MTEFWISMGKLWAFAISGILLMFLGYWIFDKLTPGIHFTRELVENKNLAVAIVVGAILLGVAVIVAANNFAMTGTTKAISLVLIGSALVFGGWSCARPADDDDDPDKDKTTGTYHGSSGITYHSGWRPYSGYGGSSYRGSSGGTSHPSTTGISARGGFGSHGAHVGA